MSWESRPLSEQLFPAVPPRRYRWGLALLRLLERRKELLCNYINRASAPSCAQPHVSLLSRTPGSTLRLSPLCPRFAGGKLGSCWWKTSGVESHLGHPPKNPPRFSAFPKSPPHFLTRLNQLCFPAPSQETRDLPPLESQRKKQTNLGAGRVKCFQGRCWILSAALGIPRD